MSPQRVQTIFLQTCEILDPVERSAALDLACDGDDSLRRQVEKLLDAHDRSGDFLVATHATDPRPTNRKPLTATAIDRSAGAEGRMIAGRYKLLELIGEGGMGAVWMAEQREPVKRLVAVKLVKPGMDSRDVLARFEAERQALALMDHANIARVFDGGATQDGRPYFAMELVKGLPITEYCDARRLPLEQRLKLFAQVCAAVQHAHQKGILHRDLKPSNVLVTEQDGVPVPKVIDFGLAKALHSGQALTDLTLHTGYGVVVGTPLYMAPEQVGINSIDVDTRADVYALGALLYELVTGATPLERATLKQAAWNEVVRLIREEDPPRPSDRIASSTALADLAARRDAEPARLGRLVRGDLDWIVMKALEKDRGRRYESANALGRDLGRFLADEPIEARPPSRMYLVGKFVRRHRMATIFAAVVAFCLLAGVAGTTIGMFRAESERAGAVTVRGQEAEQRKLADRRRDEAVRERKRAEDSAEEALDARDASRRQLVRANLSAARAQSDYGRPEAALHWLVEAWREDQATNRPENERSDADALHRLRVGRALEEMPTLVGYCQHAAPVIAADCDASGRTVVSLTGDEFAYLWDSSRGEIVAKLRHPAPVAFAQLLPDGKRIATGASDGTLSLWNATDGSLVRSWNAEGAVRSGSIAPDGLTLAVATAIGGAIYAVDDPAATVGRFAPDRGVDFVDYDSTGSRIVSASIGAREARVWNAATGDALSPALPFERELRGEPRSVERVHALENQHWPAFSPSGNTLASFDAQSIHFWSEADGVRAVRIPSNLPGSRLDVSFASDEQAVVTLRGSNQSIYVVQTKSGKVDERKFATYRQPTGVRVFPERGVLLVPISGGIVEIFDYPSLRKSSRALRNAAPISVLRAVGTRDRTLVAGLDGSVRIYEDLAKDPSAVDYRGDGGSDDRLTVPGTRYDASGAVSLVAVPEGCELRRDGRKVGPTLEHPGGMPVRISRDGRFGITADRSSAKVWALEEPPRLLKALDVADVSWAAFSDDGERFALQACLNEPFAFDAADAEVSVWRMANFERVFFAAAPRANRAESNATLGLIGAGQNSTKNPPVWDVSTGIASPIRPLRSGGVPGLTFGPDDRLGLPVTDGTVQQLDARTGELVGPTISMWPYTPRRVAYSPDGKLLACVTSTTNEGSAEETAKREVRVLHLIDARTGETLLRQDFVGPKARSLGPPVWFSADGRRLILNGDHDPWVGEYELPGYAGPAEPLALYARLITATSSDDFGALSPLPETELMERREEYLDAWRSIGDPPLISPGP